MGSMYYYELIYRSVGSIIYGCKMISFTTNLEIMNKVGAQRNETFRGGNKIHGKDTTPDKTKGSKRSNWSDKVDSITLAS